MNPFKAKLLESIEDAERIEIIEHSCARDYASITGIDINNTPTVEYKRIALAKDQQEHFLSIIKEMSGARKNKLSTCIFEPHHSIEFHFSDGTKSLIQICFKCDRTIWEDIGLLEPRKFLATFADFVAPLGFQRERDWKALAAEQVGN